jgi:hypothetical protein
MRLLRAAAEMRLQGRVDEALAALTAVRDSLPEAARQRAEALMAQLQLEQPLFLALQRVERRGNDDSIACQQLERATGAEYFEFHKDLVGRVHCEAARYHLLVALDARDFGDSRAAEPVARAYLATRDPNAGRLCERLLAGSYSRDPQGTREALESLLRETREHPETRARADQILKLTTGPAAAPPPR